MRDTFFKNEEDNSHVVRIYTQFLFPVLLRRRRNREKEKKGRLHISKTTRKAKELIIRVREGARERKKNCFRYICR